VGEEIPVPFSVAQEVGRLRRLRNFSDYPLDKEARETAERYLAEQEEKDCAIPDDVHMTIEAEDRLIVINACFGSRTNETLGKLISALLMSKLGESLVVHSDAYRIMLQLPRRLSPEAVVELLMETSPENVEALLRLYLKRSSYLRWKFIYVAKKFGALKKDVDYKQINIEKVMQSLEETPLMEEAVEKCLWELLDAERATGVLKDLQSGNISIERSKLSPIGKAGIEERGDVMMPRRPTHAILMAMKSRLEKERVALVCTHCRAKSMRHVSAIGDSPKCIKCGAIMLAILRRTEMSNVRLMEKTKPTNEEKKIIKRIMKSANLVKTHGKKAVLALAARGVGPDKAAKILAQQHDDEDEFLAEILNAEVTYARTRRFWD
jgi:ATP-dependent Lhr-like helicase